MDSDGSDRAPSVGHRLEEWGLVLVAILVRVLPERAALALGSGLGWLVGAVLRIRRPTVERNLTRAFPDVPDPRRRALVTAAYRHLGREAVTLLRLGALDPDEVVARTELVGEHLLHEALDREGGAVVLMGHMGNWEVAAAGLSARGFPLDAVGRRQSNPLFDQRVRAMREGFGMRALYRHGSTRALLRGIRNGRIALLVADQNINFGGVFVDFFGTPAAAARGPGVLSLRTGVPAFFVSALRLPGAGARYELQVHPVPRPDTGSLDDDVHTIVQTFHRLLEESIRRAPEQYFWFHRRWKTRPE